MIDLNICAKCPRCRQFCPSRTDKDGKVLALPSVQCELAEADGCLLGDSKLPEDCPYILEQQLLEEEAYDDFEDLKEDSSSSEEKEE